MMRLAADENFNFHIVRGIRRQYPDIDIVAVQEAGLAGADDPDVLEWAADADRVLFTHDVQTMTRFAWERVANGQSMPGLFEVDPNLGIGPAIEELVLIATCGEANEFENRVHYLPWS